MRAPLEQGYAVDAVEVGDVELVHVVAGWCRSARPVSRSSSVRKCTARWVGAAPPGRCGWPSRATRSSVRGRSPTARGSRPGSRLARRPLVPPPSGRQRGHHRARLSIAVHLSRQDRVLRSWVQAKLEAGLARRRRPRAGRRSAHHRGDLDRHEGSVCAETIYQAITSSSPSVEAGAGRSPAHEPVQAAGTPARRAAAPDTDGHHQHRQRPATAADRAIEPSWAVT